MSDVQLLHNPGSPAHFLALASGSGTNFREAVFASREPGSNFSIDVLLTDKTKNKKGEIIGAINYAKDFRIEHHHLNGFKYCGSWEEAKKTVEGKAEYERKCLGFNLTLLEIVRELECEKGFEFDGAVLAGYMRLFKGALLRRFNNRAYNVHPAELGEVDHYWNRKFIGENAVYDALNAGKERTRSSIIIVDPETDAGAILVSGPWHTYGGERPVSQLAADKHQDEQKRISDWPALRFALRAIANGEIGLHKRKFWPDGNPVVVYKGNEMPYCGVDLKDTR